MEKDTKVKKEGKIKRLFSKLGKFMEDTDKKILEKAQKNNSCCGDGKDNDCKGKSCCS